MTTRIAVVGRVGDDRQYIATFPDPYEASEFLSSTVAVVDGVGVDDGSYYIDWPCHPRDLDECSLSPFLETSGRDLWGRLRVAAWDESCHGCGQPDNCGDCNHARIEDSELDILRG